LAGKPVNCGYASPGFKIKNAFGRAQGIFYFFVKGEGLFFNR